jgi:deazaflavin-dependent oxidoreductase (nitroreductase family)
MAEPAANPWEESLIADLRANDGTPSRGPLEGQSLLVMYTTGAKSGQRRRQILTYSREGDAYIVAGSASGAPSDPAWIANVRANPEVEIELGNQTHEATAEVVGESDRERLWNAHVAALPWFADYEAQAGRKIPIVRITTKGSPRPVG